MRDESSYLRYYLELLLRRWQLILVAGLTAAILALLLTVSVARTYQAEATVAILRSRTEVEFDPRIRTLSDYELARADAGSRQDALVALVRSNEVVQRVLDDVSAYLKSDERELDSLRDMVETQTTGDLININVQYEDPEVAALIANRWVEHYERYINNVYSSSHSTVDSGTGTQAAGALEIYNEAQQALQKFTAEDAVPALQREVETQEALLNNYRRMLVQLQGGPVENRQALLGNYYEELQQIESWLSDAHALREQVSMDSNSSAAEMGNALALILLRSRIFSGATSLRVNSTPMQEGVVSQSQGQVSDLVVQMDLSSVSAEGISTSDVDSVIEVLEQRRVAAHERIENLANSIDSGEPVETSTSGEAQLVAQIGTLEAQIAGLWAEIETQTARRRELEQARDRAWDTYQVLLGKQIEEGITSESPAAEVRIADTAVEPSRPLSRGLLRNVALAAMAAVMLATGTVIVVDWWKNSEPGLQQQEWSSPSESTGVPGTAEPVAVTPGAGRPGSLSDSVT